LEQPGVHHHHYLIPQQPVFLFLLQPLCSHSHEAHSITPWTTQGQEKVKWAEAKNVQSFPPTARPPVEAPHPSSFQNETSSHLDSTLESKTRLVSQIHDQITRQLTHNKSVGMCCCSLVVILFNLYSTGLQSISKRSILPACPPTVPCPVQLLECWDSSMKTWGIVVREGLLVFVGVLHVPVSHTDTEQA